MADVMRSEDVIIVPIENLEPNNWNPQVMSDGKFNELVEEMREDGFDEPIHVVTHPDPAKSQAGVFLIINGEHRWQAARVLGILAIPCVVKNTWNDEKIQQIKTVRRNLLHGEIDRTRFTKLVHRLNDVGVPMKELPGLLGFENEEAFREKFIAEERERQESEQRGAVKTAKESEKDESAIIENLSFILNQIFSEYGDTVPQGFMFFCHKNKFHLMVQMDEKLEGQIEAAVRYLRASGKNVNPFFRRAIDNEFEAIRQAEGVDPRKAREIKTGDDGDDESFLDDSSDSDLEPDANGDDLVDNGDEALVDSDGTSEVG